MREILFKAKCLDGGNWIYGDLIHHSYGTTIGIVDSDGLHELDINEDTICQYTGLTDNEGKRIWENDIIITVCDWEQNPNYGVVWNENELGFIATNGKEDYGQYYEYLTCCDEVIVIGNIFDNPELLRCYRKNEKSKN